MISPRAASDDVRYKLSRHFTCQQLVFLIDAASTSLMTESAHHQRFDYSPFGFRVTHTHLQFTNILVNVNRILWIYYRIVIASFLGIIHSLIARSKDADVFGALFA
jgi:hypothetical protein